MMSSLTHALYSDLLLDLQPYCSAHTFELISAGKIDFFPGCTVRDVAVMQLATSLLKKLQDDTSPNADQLALTKFRDANSACGSWSLQVNSLLDELLISNFRVVIDEFFFNGDKSFISDDLVTLLAESDLVGPGVALGASGNDFYTKMFSSPMACTRTALYEAYKIYLKQLPDSWQIADSLRRDSLGGPEVVEGNRLTFVPKTRDISRSICIEPSLNMMFQKGLGNALARRLRQYFGIDLSSQQVKNRELARLGSETGGWSTIDLSSASDTISLKMLREFLPRHVLAVIELLRSPKSMVSLTGETMQLEMVSTMGNGFTFPLQTVLFAAVVTSCARVAEMPLVLPHGNNLGSFGVNGDDIVCPTGLHDKVVRLLTLLGFEVNKTKSFHEGPFRESCGGDFFNGSLVRGVYIKTLLDQQSRYSAINLLNRWSARHGIPLRLTVQRLLRTVRYLPVPPWEDLSAGVHVPWSMVKRLRRCKHTRSVLYERMVFEPVKLRIQDCEIVVPTKERSRIYNPHGLLISILHGAVRGTRSNTCVGTISIRHDRGWFRRKWGIAPNWSCTSTIREPIPDEGRWESAVWVNHT